MTRPGMTARDELRSLTHTRLLTAGEAIFERDGYWRTTVSNITTAANVSRATFYLHFNDKSDLLLAVLQGTLAETPAYFRYVDAALVDGGRDKLRSALRRTLNWYQQHGQLLRTSREAMTSEPHLAEKTEGNFARFADEMHDYLASLSPDQRVHAHRRLQLLIIQLDQVAFRLVVQGLQRVEQEPMLDELTDIWQLVLPPAGRN